MSAESHTSQSPTPVTDIANALHEKYYREHPEHVAPVPAPAATHPSGHAPESKSSPAESEAGAAANAAPAHHATVDEALAEAAGEIATTVDAVPKPKRRIPLSYGAGVALIAGGVAGVVLPGIPGFPLLILGAAVLAPTVPALASADTWVQERFPEVYKEALDFADRFAADFEKRFPSSKPQDGSVNGKEQ